MGHDTDGDGLRLPSVRAAHSDGARQAGAPRSGEGGLHVPDDRI